MKQMLLVAVACAALPAAAGAAVFWQDDDPVSGISMVANLTVNTVDASGITSDATRTAVGDVILTGAAKFVGINPGPLPISSVNHGKDYTLSLDYFVPVGTTLDDNGTSGPSPDLFWIQVDVNGANIGSSAGFIGGGAAGSGWQTLVLSGVVPSQVGPNPSTSTTPLFVMADGGFGDGTANGSGQGTALFIDNIRFEVAPEPGALSLLLLSGVGLASRRRV